MHRLRPILVALLLAVSTALAQQEQYRERQVLDPQSGEWTDAPPAEPGTPAGQLEEARRLIAEGEPREARKLLEDWVEQNPEHERYLEGVFFLGEAYFQEGNFYKAYEQYEIVAESGSGDLFTKALQREVDVARAFFSGEKRIVWGFLRLRAFDEAVQILDRVWERVPGTRLGELALKLKADHFFGTGEMDLAQDEYVNLVQEYPRGRYVQFGMLRSAESAAAAFPGVQFDDRPLVEAQVRYRQLEATFPEYADRQNVDTRLEGIRELRGEKDLVVAKWYEKTGQAGAAEYYYRQILRDWPDTLAADEARGRLRGLGVPLEEASSDTENQE